MTEFPFDNQLSESVWRNKYRCRPEGSPNGETTILDSWRRVAAAIAAVETSGRRRWKSRFLELLDGFRFLPAGRILAGAGTGYRSTLFNCFVMGQIEDSVDGIFSRLKEAAITMQRGGGIGCDFSTLRPSGMAAKTAGTTASGPVPFMQMWDSMCATILSTGARRGAMMGTLRCDHPDIEAFIDAKRERGALTNFNLSVQISDDFLHALEKKTEWPLVFPDDEPSASDTVDVRWPGYETPVTCAVHRRVPAADLWQRLTKAAYDTAEPGVLFVDRINRRNNLYYREQITTTNPCGEIPLPPHGACNLGSINLATFVKEPFSSHAELDLDAIGSYAQLATRFLDNVIDASNFPLEEQAREALGSRRIGLGITGLADALIMLGQHYDSDAARDIASAAVRTIRDEAYRSSTELAREKGSFPFFDREAYLDGVYVKSLPRDIRDGIARHGIRNSHLLAIAPAGSISVLANNVSSGLEPVYALDMNRRMLNREGCFELHPATDFACAQWRREVKPGVRLPSAFVTALELSPEAHLLMHAVLQPLVDNSISKTVNVRQTVSADDFAAIYRRAIELDLNGCTVFRVSASGDAILSPREPGVRSHCCSPEREGD